MRTGALAGWIRELAGQAEDLRAALDDAAADFGSAGDPVHGAGYRLASAAGCARQAAKELLDTAADLDRLAARPRGACEIGWGVCPEHGNTLTSGGDLPKRSGRSRCTKARCSRSWGYDRLAMPCEEPAIWLLTDREGAQARVCDPHAADARARLDGARLAPLDHRRTPPAAAGAAAGRAMLAATASPRATAVVAGTGLAGETR